MCPYQRGRRQVLGLQCLWTAGKWYDHQQHDSRRRPGLEQRCQRDLGAGWTQTCAVTSAGGSNAGAEMATVSSATVRSCGTGACSAPVDVIGLSTGVLAVSAGANHTCALTAAGGVKCWGYNGYGQLGNGNYGNAPQSTPVGVSGLSIGVSAISSGVFHTCALTTVGGVKCWGDNGAGELGNGTNSGPQSCAYEPCSTTPVDATGLASGVAAVSAGNGRTCALTTAAGVKCWGGTSCGGVCTTASDVSGPEWRGRNLSRKWTQLCSHYRRRSQVLGRERLWSARGRDDSRWRYSSIRHRPNQRRRCCFRRNVLHVRAHGRRRRQVLGLQLGRRAWERNQCRPAVMLGLCVQHYPCGRIGPRA